MSDSPTDWDAIADEEQEWADPKVSSAQTRKETVVSVRLPAEIVEAARRLAAEREMTLSAWARDAISRTVHPATCSMSRSFDLSRRTFVTSSVGSKPLTSTSLREFEETA